MPKTTKTDKQIQRATDKEISARIKRANQSIQETLKREGVALTVPRARLFFRNSEGKYRSAGTVTMEFLGRCQCPADIVIFAQPELVPGTQKNGQS